jgi:hypothetical protein
MWVAGQGSGSGFKIRNTTIMKTPLRLILSLSGLAAGATAAASLSEAEFTRVINDVQVLPVEASPVPAKMGDRISGRTAVSTGAQSRAELRFPDKTLTRVGANSIFRMDASTKTVDLEKGVILLQVPKQLGGAKVRTAAVTAAVTGTTLLVEFTPDGFIKIIVIEGEVDVSLNERRSQFRTLVAGDLWITRADDKTGLPLPVQIDLGRLQKTSKLLNDGEFTPLGNEKQVQEALEGQARKKMDGELLNTSFQIEGRGRNVTLTQGGRQHVNGVGPGPIGRPPGRKAVPGQKKSEGAKVLATFPSKPINIPETTVFDDQSTINTFSLSNAYNSVAGGFVPLPGATYLPGQDGPFGDYMFDDPQAFSGIDALLSERASWFVLKGDELYISGDPSVESAGGPRNLLLGATGEFNFTATPPFAETGVVPGDHWTLDGNTDALMVASSSGSINFDSFKLTGTTQNVGFFADGPVSDVNITGRVPLALISLPGGSFEASAGQDVNVSGAIIESGNIKLSSRRDIRLGGHTAGPAKLAASGSVRLQAQQGVKITNSSQLLRLAQLDNPQVWIEAINGNLEVIEGSSVDADIVNMISQRGDVRLMSSTIAAREIKARVFDTGGTLLLSNAILGNGTNPSNLIRLYGEGAGGVRFVGDTTLRGDLVDIAGASVTIDPGSRVRLSNPAGTTVFSDAHQFNDGMNGNFTGLSDNEGEGGPVDVVKKPYSNRPGY